MATKKTTPEDIDAFVKAAEEARKIPFSKAGINRINEISKRIEIEQSEKNHDNQKNRKVAKSKDLSASL